MPGSNANFGVHFGTQAFLDTNLVIEGLKCVWPPNKRPY